MATGRIGEYAWAEFTNETPELTVPAVVRGLAAHVRGLRGVSVSWDSGRLLPTDPKVDATWEFRDGFAVTPTITDDLIDRWPYSACSGSDEWYFFSELPSELRLASYCNWVGASVGDWESYTFEVDLAAQLASSKPELVIGEGDSIYLICRKEIVVVDFLRLAREA